MVNKGEQMRIVLLLTLMILVCGVGHTQTKIPIEDVAKTEKYLVIIDSGSGTSSWDNGARTSFEKGEVIRVEKYKDQKKSDMSRSELNNIVVVMDLTKEQHDMLMMNIREDVFDEKTKEKINEREIEPRKYKVDISKLQSNEFIEEPDVTTIIDTLITK